ncbi:MAG: DUF262 domain-containing protein [Halanaerobiales bacterium]|nr:DUF262 domain-containing protein [Halanaerobiales bacterium]MCF8008220.1 DUF262 domain-containing protein [Halanaerobiales bacterium]
MKQYLKDGIDLNKIIRNIKGANENISIILPSFQRSFKWDTNRQKRLLASFLVNIPIGGFLLLEGKNNEYSNKRIGFRNIEVPSNKIKSQCKYLLDGQQRITSLYTIFTDFIVELIDKKEKNPNITYRTPHKYIRNRWYINLSPKAPEDDDIFGLKYFNFNKIDDLELRPPEEIVDYIEQYKIRLGKDTGKWYHPNNDRKIIKNIKGNRLPLYYLYNMQKQQKFNNILDLIARRQINIIIDECLDTDDKEQLRKIYNRTINNYEDKLTMKGDFLNCFFKQPNPSETSTFKDIKSDLQNLSNMWTRNLNDYFKDKLKNSLSVYILPKEEVHRAITIFENMNKGGVKLDVYDLIVAKAAKEMEKSLTKEITSIIQQRDTIPKEVNSSNQNIEFDFTNLNIMSKDELNKTKIKNQFLNLLSILYYGDTENIDISQTKKSMQLKIPAIGIENNYEKAISSLKRAYEFMYSRLGLTKVTDLHYQLMILPISYCLKDGWFKKNPETKYNKIEYWYWMSIFSGLYRERQNKQSIKDIKRLSKWINGENNGNWIKRNSSDILNVRRYSNLDTLSGKDEYLDIPNAIKKALNQYIISREPRDLYYSKKSKIIISANNIVHGKIEKENHHIIPKKSMPEEVLHNLDKSIIRILSESPLNITPISKSTNLQILQQKLDSYIEDILNKEDKYGEILSGHFINNTKINELASQENKDADFYENYITEFIADRFKKIKDSLKYELDSLLK